MGDWATPAWLSGWLRPARKKRSSNRSIDRREHDRLLTEARAEAARLGSRCESLRESLEESKSEADQLKAKLTVRELECRELIAVIGALHAIKEREAAIASAGVSAAQSLMGGRKRGIDVPGA